MNVPEGVPESLSGGAAGGARGAAVRSAEREGVPRALEPREPRARRSPTAVPVTASLLFFLHFHYQLLSSSGLIF